MAPQAKMIYFPFHGLGEPLRFMMAYTGVTWEEEIIALEDFPARKEGKKTRITISPA